ncbi:MAG: sugar phosphate isomerase/epimerase family protein [Armatimonadota bacterium]
MLSISTDYFAYRGSAIPYLREIAEAGFRQVHWCHEWCTDYLYSEKEVRKIGEALDEFGLTVRDLHSTTAFKRDWGSRDPVIRRAGIALTVNRIRMAAMLGAQVVVLHLPLEQVGEGRWEIPLATVRWSLDELLNLARRYGVRLALEIFRATTRRSTGNCSRNIPTRCSDSVTMRVTVISQALMD